VAAAARPDPVRRRPARDRLVPAALEWHAACPRSRFKFVCQSPAEVDEAARLAGVYGVPPARTWIMPEGVTAARVLEVARAIAPAAAQAGLNLTLRQHVLIYDAEGEPRGG
jgi:7-carboxy-7-deazaguanine synthase